MSTSGSSRNMSAIILAAITVLSLLLVSTNEVGKSYHDCGSQVDKKVLTMPYASCGLSRQTPHVLCDTKGFKTKTKGRKRYPS